MNCADFLLSASAMYCNKWFTASVISAWPSPCRARLMTDLSLAVIFLPKALNRTVKLTKAK